MAGGSVATDKKTPSWGVVEGAVECVFEGAVERVVVRALRDDTVSAVTYSVREPSRE